MILKKIAEKWELNMIFLFPLELVGALPFWVSYCVTGTFYGKRSTGKSINKILSKTLGDENYKAKGGFLKYLTNGYLTRVKIH